MTNMKPCRGSEHRRLIRLRDAAYKRQRGICWWCSTVMRYDVDQNHPTRVTGDHIFPRAAGGKTEEHNVVAACYKCNWSHGVEFNTRRPDTKIPYRFWKQNNLLKELTSAEIRSRVHIIYSGIGVGFSRC